MFSKEAILLLVSVIAFLLATNHIQSIYFGNKMSNWSIIKRDITLRTSRKYHLPLPTGPYPNIGYIDILTGTDQNDGVLGRLLYPASNQTTDPKVNCEEWPNWYPCEQYMRGYFNVLNVNSSLLIKLFDMFRYNVYIPTLENLDPLRLDNHKFPVIIYSHGLSSCRTTYSNVCYELASYGFIVFVVEHRDASACTSFYPNKDDPQQFKWIQYKHAKDFDDEFEGRNKQLNLRVADIRKVIDLINLLQNGEQVVNVLKPQIESQRFAALFDLNKIIVMGHSFGSATAIRAVQHIESVKLGICLDAWMYGLRDDDTSLVTKPLLFVNMESFQWSINLRKMKEYVAKDGKNTDKRQVLTILEARHVDPSDMPFVLGSFIKWMTRMNSKVDPFIVHDLCTALSLQFIEDKLQIELKKNKNDFIDKYRNHLKPGLEDIE